MRNTIEQTTSVVCWKKSSILKYAVQIIVISLLFVGLCYALPAIEWQCCLGGSDEDWAHSIQQTRDGGYIVTGGSRSNDGDVTGCHGFTDYWVVKLDSTDSIEWQRCLGGSDWDEAHSIQQTSDGGYVVAGMSSSNDGDVTGNHSSGIIDVWDYWIVKLDSAGLIEWQRCLGGSSSDVAQSIQQISDGGYIVAGSSNSNDGDVTGNHGDWDYWVVKLDSAGSIKWQRSYGGSSTDVAHSIQQTIDDGYIVAGWSGSDDGDVIGNHGVTDCWIVKLDSVGAIEWQHCLGGSSIDDAYSIQQTSDGGYIVAGSSYSNNGDVTGNHGVIDCWIVKLDSSGLIEWQRCLGGSGEDEAYSIQQTSDGGFIIAGLSYSNDGDVTGNHGGGDYWLVKLDSVGIMEWQSSLGGSNGDYANSVQQTNDSGYIVAGSSKSNDGDVTGNHGNDDYWVIKLTQIIDTTAPIATLVEPSLGKNSACLHQKIVYTIIDSAGEVDWSSVLIDVNGIIYDSTSLSRSGDTIYYMPIAEWVDGDTIKFSLLSASDISGNAVSSLPISGSTVIDSSYPKIWGNIPADGDTVRDLFPTITAFIKDDYSLVKNIDLIIEADTFNLSSPEVSYIDSAYTYIPSSPLPTGLVKICLSNVSDDVFYCGPNITPDYCWNINVIIDTTAPVTRLIEPSANTFTSVKRQPIRIILDDEGGILLSSISLTVDSINYDLASPQLKLEDDTLIFTPSSDLKEGLISVSLSPYFDLAGNSGDPLNYIFHTDFTKPTQLTIYPSPGSHILTDTVTIYIELIDLNHGSGIDTSTLQLEINSLIVPFTFDITADIFVKISYFFDGSTVMGDSARIILSGLQDMVDYGPRNIDDNLSYKFTFTSGIQEQILPNQTYLNAYPNPFNPSVTINFPNSSSIEIYDINGRIVHSQENVNSGKLVWQPDETISSGVYLVRATTSDGQQISKRIVYLK